MKYSLGVGLTSACTFSCRHCYSGGGQTPVEMDTELLFRFLSSCPVDSINLGTGESCLHPEFHQVLKRFYRMGLPVAITTAGPSVQALSDHELSCLHDVDFSLDFPDRDSHDNWRAEGAFDMVLNGIERCRTMGVTASVAMCLMEQNAGMMKRMCSLCRDLGVSLRVNVYKPVFTDIYQPSYDAFWQAVNDFFESSDTAVSSEPVVNAALAETAGNPVFVSQGSPCGTSSLRLRPGGEILPCVYWDRSSDTMQRFVAGECSLPDGCRNPVPDECRECPYLDLCRGGCSGRRLYTGLERPDIYCFRMPGKEIPPLHVPVPLTGDAYIHSSYLCTMIAEFH